MMFSMRVSVCLIFLVITSSVQGKWYSTSPGNCRINENYTPCTQLCPPTCDAPNPTCRVDCTRSSCNCIQGYVYNHEGRCIPSTSCLHRMPIRCEYNLQCPSSFSCIRGFCAEISSGQSTGVFSSYASSTSAHRHQVQFGSLTCTRDKHCPDRKICINGYCKMFE
ncbi:hypothetical protein B9Z55_024630 [Caenorhabditis nigoni]|uniref:TIL domain-containing protein n=2 Tax=Caenorhabditis nigoni TaxID=1611254 RepID=A0A2G5SUT9_9PELO|nr:hypothetical protein B9Z55_024630 [Caenorhabditis nigoni]